MDAPQGGRGRGGADRNRPAHRPPTRRCCGHSHTPEFTLAMRIPADPRTRHTPPSSGTSTRPFSSRSTRPRTGRPSGRMRAGCRIAVGRSRARRGVGVEVLRDAARSGARAITAMPVTFASALHVGEPRPQAGRWLRRMGPGTMQTPQVWLDHQAFEEWAEHSSSTGMPWMPSSGRSAPAADARRLCRPAPARRSGWTGAGARLETGRDVDPFRHRRPRRGRGAPDTPRKADRRPDPTPVTALTGPPWRLCRPDPASGL